MGPSGQRTDTHPSMHGTFKITWLPVTVRQQQVLRGQAAEKGGRTTKGLLYVGQCFISSVCNTTTRMDKGGRVCRLQFRRLQTWNRGQGCSNHLKFAPATRLGDYGLQAPVQPQRPRRFTGNGRKPSLREEPQVLCRPWAGRYF